MADADGITSALSGLSFSSRKPELPAFDKRNVAIWVRRVENAFIRSNVTLARDKFAFIEAKFGVDADPNINELLYGEATAENWDAFMTYLKTTYGRSVRDKTAAVLDTTPREGRRPSQLLANIRERMGDVTLDQLLKERILRELPTDIRQLLAQPVKDLNAKETAALADNYFTIDGQRVFRNSSVNSVQSIPHSVPPAATEDVESAVNAVRSGARPKQPTGQTNTRDSRSKSRPRVNGAGYVHQNPDLCYYHDRYAAKARNCNPGCKWDKSPNAQGPRRA